MLGAIHHIEIYVKNLKVSKEFYSWLLPLLGYKMYQSWDCGFSFLLDKTYIVFVQTTEKYLKNDYNRCNAGLNHLCFHGESKKFVDEITKKIKEKNINILYKNKHPYAGGKDYYAVYFEDPDRIKLEITANKIF